VDDWRTNGERDQRADGHADHGQAKLAFAETEMVLDIRQARHQRAGGYRKKEEAGIDAVLRLDPHGVTSRITGLGANTWAVASPRSTSGKPTPNTHWMP